ncbi:MAG: hypoxanthine phosphoribosyltransferase [Anaerolineae bacterium]|nr:hypoxanthine phosphoribosyltransferase [Anaerolineae bacterium]
MTELWEKYLAEELIPADRLQTRIEELGQQISVDYRDKDLLLLCILKGGVLFLTDLMRQLSIPHEIDFMAVSSYGKEVRESTGVVRILKDLDQPIENRHVLIVEDIIDSGHTLNYITRILRARLPASLKICTLLDKAERREVDIPIDYTGFVIPNKFVFGYGLDLDEKFRNLPFIGVVNTDLFVGE